MNLLIIPQHWIEFTVHSSEANRYNVTEIMGSSFQLEWKIDYYLRAIKGSLLWFLLVSLYDAAKLSITFDFLGEFFWDETRFSYNVCFKKIWSKHSSNTRVSLLRIFMKQTLVWRRSRNVSLFSVFTLPSAYWACYNCNSN